MALQEGKVPEHLPLKKGRDLEMCIVTPRGEEQCCWRSAKGQCCWRSAKQSFCVLQTWWDRPWVLGQTGRTWLPGTVSPPCFEGMPGIYQFSSCKGRPFSPFPFPPRLCTQGRSPGIRNPLVFHYWHIAGKMQSFRQ